MIEIEMHDVSEEFRLCWVAAGRHLSMQVQGGSLSWLKASLTPPFLEHLSFYVTSARHWTFSQWPLCTSVPETR